MLPVTPTANRSLTGLQSLMRNLIPVPCFSALIVSEQESLGRESVATGARITTLAQAGVEIFEYFTVNHWRHKTGWTKAMSAMRSAAVCGHSEIAEVHVVPHALSREESERIVSGVPHACQLEPHDGLAEGTGRAETCGLTGLTVLASSGCHLDGRIRSRLRPPTR